MCAWLNTTASTCLGSNGKQQLRWMDSSRRPWNKPHSSNNRLPLTSNRYIEPVVVRVAPKQWICMGQSCCVLRVASRKWLRPWRIFHATCLLSQMPKFEIQDPTRCDGATARREEARWPKSEMQTPGQTRFFLHRFVFRLGLSGLAVPRSEEHTSELQSLRHLVCRLLLEKKK